MSKQEEIKQLLIRYGLSTTLTTKLYASLDTIIFLANHYKQNHQPDNNQIAVDSKNLVKWLNKIEQEKIEKIKCHRVNFNIEVNGKTYNLIFKSDHFINPLLEKVKEQSDRLPLPTDMPNKRGRKLTFNKTIIESFGGVAQDLKNQGLTKNIQVYNFIFDFLTICEFDWTQTSIGTVKPSDQKKARIDLIKKHLKLGPKGK